MNNSKCTSKRTIVAANTCFFPPQKRILLTLFLWLIFANLSVSQAIIDSCFMSPAVGTSFSSTINMTGNNSDLLSWTGSTWTGGWPAANLTIPPPNNGVGCRAIFIGNGQSWTTGGEGFGLRFSPALVSGQTYTFNITYVSHGTGSDGNFSPLFYTNSNGSLSGAFLVGNLTPVGYSWTSNPITFTANAAQAGHTWIYISSGSNGSSGLINNFCPSCNTTCNPTFTPVGPYCAGASIPPLPTTSANGVPGTWSPAINNTTTTTYTFTPSNGCATTASLTITINPYVTPSFTTLGPYCVGATPGTLPATSTNGISGTWSPSTITTATAGTSTYTFTPTSGQCAATTTMNVTVNANTTPAFTTLGPYCVGATPGSLPGTSTNGITGTWSPAIINTATAGTNTYTFTPTAGQCATTTTMNVTVSAGITPDFTALGPYCEGATPETLPNTSTNGISGTWSPATITTAAAGTSTYTFTPAAGQCATATTMNVTVNPTTTPAFTALGPYCVGATPGILPGTSTNGISGTWSPETINTNTAGTSTYTFTPEPTGQCTLPATMNVVISAVVDIYASSAQANICFGNSTQIFAGGATNYVWQPGNLTGSYISVSPSNTTTYTVTGELNGCNATDTITVHVFPYPVITFGADRKEGCEDMLVQFTDLSNFDDASWYWEFGDYTFSYEQNPLHYFYDPGSFDVSLTMTTIYGCTSTFLWPDMITVFKSPEAEIVSVPEFPSELSPTVWFYDRSFAASAWEWDFGDYNALINNSNEQNPIHQYSDTGYFEVMLIALTPMGCADTTIHTIYIAPEAAFFVPNAFTPNEDEKNSSFICKGNGIRWETFEMRIYDRWGKQLLYTQDALAGWNGKYKGSEMPQDVYVWLISFMDVCLQKHDLKGTVTLIK